MFTMNNKKQPPEVFYKKASLKNFSIFTGKHLCLRFFLIKLQVFSSATLLKRDFNTVLFLWILRNFWKRLFWRKSVNRCYWIMSSQIFYPFISNRCSYKCFLTLTEKHLRRNVLFKKHSSRPIFIQKEAPALVFYSQLSEIFNNDVLNT